MPIDRDATSSTPRWRASWWSEMPPRILPTRRGLAVVAVAGAGFAMGATFGPRSLDAVVLPAGIVLLAAGVQLALLDSPRAERTTPPAGDPGSTRTVRLAVATDTPVTAVVHDRLPDGVDGDAAVTGLIGREPFAYTVTYRERGAHVLGPTTVSARDVLGLARRTFVLDRRDTVLVYPRVFYPSAPVGERLRALAHPDRGVERGAFDHLREYARGDSLRDVHWKSSAKREALVVQEFADDGDRRTVTMAVGAASGRADAMAEAAATVGYALLDEGISVSLTTPDGRLSLTPGDASRLLAHLARVDAGDVGADADVVVHADDEVTVRIDGTLQPFDPGRRRRIGSGDGDGWADGDGDDSSQGTRAADRPTSITEVRA
ncbi:DUF58 domain-containing protein [Haloplanus pelagicus]|uniref:DUF58 domain-containing protein n=1 Tax=Haloplanus pelagicus TaxID=2949995 RepID=UPI00203DA9FB|nr:DUF58 domain-containing protein [Haloplanus sp. HW8-1]